MLKDWDGVESLDSKGAVAFHAIYIHLVQNIFQDELQSFGDGSFDTFYSLKYIRTQAIRSIFDGKTNLWVDNVKTVKKETLNDIVNKSFEDAFIFLKDKYGNPSELMWGDVHQVTYEHNLDADPLVQRLINFSVGPFPMAGSEMTPRDNGFSILPTGQSGLFRSKHYRDQTEMYNRGEFKPFMFTYDAINSSKSSKLVFKSK